MINVVFEKIHPIPTLEDPLDKVNYSVYLWESRANDVTLFKAFLKRRLRAVQLGRCCYCRRVIRDDFDAEHFLEQNDHSSHRFEITNLALSCSRCNTKKNGLYLKHKARMNKVAGFKLTGRSPWITGFYNPKIAENLQLYRLIHPYFHDYSDNMNIHMGWIYMPKTKAGFKTKNIFKLNQVSELELGYLKERIVARDSATSELLADVAMLSEGHFDLNHVIELITEYLKDKTKFIK